MRSVIVKLLLLLFLATPLMAQQSVIFDVSTVTVGPQKLETLWAHAVGKWSDAGKDVNLMSTEIHCYQRFGFCDVANAFSLDGKAGIMTGSFDILRCDDQEIIAVENSAICVVNILRFDIVAKKVTISSASKGNNDDKMCKEMTHWTEGTSFLIGAVKP